MCELNLLFRQSTLITLRVWKCKSVSWMPVVPQKCHAEHRFEREDSKEPGKGETKTKQWCFKITWLELYTLIVCLKHRKSVSSILRSFYWNIRKLRFIVSIYGLIVSVITVAIDETTRWAMSINYLSYIIVHMIHWYNAVIKPAFMGTTHSISLNLGMRSACRQRQRYQIHDTVIKFHNTSTTYFTIITNYDDINR